MLRSWQLLCLAAIAQLVLSQDEHHIVHIEQGIVKGYRDPKGDIFVFYNIPYATAPKGTEKFKPPLPAPTWEGTFEAVKDDEIMCPQPFPPPMQKPDYAHITEDCLIANVYTPDRSDNELLPVLVIIHGGAFNIGFGEGLRPVSLVSTKRIVAVTFNYRLGPNGFLCLGTEDIPGNAGLKDQVALLRWVRDNIEKFGGDPNNVTVSGSSAGSTSAILLSLSKSAEGLFQKLIPESGADLPAFAVQPNPQKNAKIFAKQYDDSLDVDDINIVENFYKQASLETLLDPHFLDLPDSTILYSPCVEKDVGQEMFLSDAPMNILKSGNFTKVPILYGLTDMEGWLKMNDFEVIKDQMNSDFQAFLPGDLYFESEEQKENITAEIKTFYFNDKPVGPETILQYVDYHSDVLYSISILQSIKLRLEADAGPIYLYEYSFVDEETAFVPYTDVRGAAHASQSAVIIDLNERTPYKESSTEEYKKMKTIMREMWLNFIITGQPTLNASEDYPYWPAASSYNSPYMSLNQTVRLGTSLLEQRFNIWNPIYDKHYSAPIPPNSAASPQPILLITLCIYVLISIVNTYKE